MVDEAANAGNANDFPRRCWSLTGTKHRTIVDALMGSFVVKIRLKFSQRQPQRRFAGEKTLAQQALFERADKAFGVAIFSTGIAVLCGAARSLLLRAVVGILP